MGSESENTKPKKGRSFSVGSRVFNPSLRLRIIFIIVGASLIIFLVTTLLLLSYQRGQLIESTESTTMALSSAILANLKHAMLTGDADLINDSVLAVVDERAVDTLRILDDQGVVSASSVEGEIGRIFIRTEPECQICHEGNRTPTNKSTIYTPSDGHRVLLNINLVQNQEECQTCHDSEDEILGLLMMESSLTSVDQQLVTGFWRTILIALASFALLIGLVIPALNRYIVQPIEELSKGVAEISDGNLDYQVPVVYQDELGALAESFDSMRQQLKITRTEMELRERELASLNEVGLAATQLLDLHEILELALDTMVNKLGMENALIYLWDESTGQFSLQASRGISKEQIEEIERRRRSGMDITRLVVETGNEVFVPDMAQDKRFDGVWDNLQDRSYVKLPLMSRGTAVGVLGVVTPAGNSLTTGDVEFLKAIGREIGIAIDNALLLADTRQSEEQAITLYNLGTQISASLSLSEVLDAVAEAARELMNTDIGLIGLVENENLDVVVKAVAGNRTNLLNGMHMKVDQQDPWNTLLEGRPIMAIVENPEQPNLHDDELITREKIQSLLAAPLMRGGQFMGLIEVMTHEPRRFGPRDGRLLIRLAHQVIIAIENAQLYRQLHHLAGLEERDRLARELHDHLAQGLGYLKVKATITDDLFSDGQFDQAQESLQELKKATQRLYTDVREQIFNLRTAVKERDSFFSILQDYLSDYRIHYGLNVHLVIENECLSEFSPEVGAQLLRIVQEALTNVRRHSDAGKVLIHCAQGGEQVNIRIEDDGRGFYPHEIEKEAGQHYGLQIMRERAESVGGSLKLDSQPGQGTRVVVQVPARFEA